MKKTVFYKNFFIQKYDKTYVMVYLNNFYSMYHIFLLKFDVIINKKIHLYINTRHEKQ